MSSLAGSTVSGTYELLVSLLSKHPETIEILPGDASVWVDAQNPRQTRAEGDSSSFPFLFVQGNLGIPQKILYKVYLHSANIFRSACGCFPMRSTMTQLPRDGFNTSLIRVLTASSSILTLANPAHQTALNIRKRLIQLHLIDPNDELRFMASLLSSQHCAKHAELWYHRRWILGSACDTCSANASSCRLRFASREALEEELSLTSRACELYPRNYFAWMHRLFCMRSLLSDYVVGLDVIGFVPIFHNEVIALKQWINCHLSDYSAVHTILAISRAAFQSGDLTLIDIIIKEDLLNHAISLVQEYPVHESLWRYVQVVLDISGIQQAEQFIENFVQPLASSEINVNYDLSKASQYAIQFLNIYSQFHSK